MNVILFFTKNDFLILPLVAPLSKHWIVTSQLRQRGGLKILSKGETFKFMYEILEGAVLVDLTCRSSRLEVLCKTGVFRNFVKFTGKHLCQRHFIKKETGTNVFLWILWIFQENLFYRTPPVVASVYGYPANVYLFKEKYTKQKYA